MSAAPWYPASTSAWRTSRIWSSIPSPGLLAGIWGCWTSLPWHLNQRGKLDQQTGYYLCAASLPLELLHYVRAFVVTHRRSRCRKTQMVALGEAAPDFTLPDQDGKSFRLSRALKSKAVVLFFYPKVVTGLGG